MDTQTRMGIEAPSVPTLPLLPDATREERERTPFEKAVDKAFSYHPYRLSRVETFDEWVVGPTFAVKGSYEQSPAEGETIYRPDPLLHLKLQGILKGAREARDEVEIDSSGHPKKQEFRTDQWGAEHPMTAKDCKCRAIRLAGNPVAELCFPLYALAKKVKPEVWRFDLATSLLFGLNGKEVVAVFAAKRFDSCLP